MDNGMIDLVTTYRTCPDCGYEHHRGLRFCPKCMAWEGKTDPFWICPRCEVEMYRSDKDRHTCDTETYNPHSTKPYDEDIVFRLARLLGDSQRVLRDASKEINRLRDS